MKVSVFWKRIPAARPVSRAQSKELTPIREKLRTAKITQRQRWVPGPPRTAGFSLSIKEYESPSWGLRVFRFAVRIHGPSLCVLGALAVKKVWIRAKNKKSKVPILHKSPGLLFHSRSPVRVAASSTAPGLWGLVFLGCSP